MDKINIYINSKNRDLNEQISNFTVRIPQNLLRLEQGEHFTLNVNGFYCYNSWFNCIDGFNNEFQIIIKNIDNGISFTYHYNLNDGNPNVNDVRTNLNNLLLNKVNITYDKQRNKFIFKRTLPVSTQQYRMYLKIINSEDFLGFYKSDRDIEILLPYLQNVLLQLNGVLAITHLNHKILMNNIIHYYNISIFIKIHYLVCIHVLILLVLLENIVMHQYVH